jgi:hypothetical protein
MEFFNPQSKPPIFIICLYDYRMVRGLVSRFKILQRYLIKGEVGGSRRRRPLLLSEVTKRCPKTSTHNLTHTCLTSPHQRRIDSQRGEIFSLRRQNHLELKRHHVRDATEPSARRGVRAASGPYAAELNASRPKTGESCSRSDLFTIVSISQQRTKQDVQNRFWGTWRRFFNHLAVPLDADSPHKAPRNEDEISGRESETHRPPDGGEEQGVPPRSEGVCGQ